MVLTTIFAVRHGFRPYFNTNPHTGEIKLSVPSPTGIATDPALTSYGVRQAEELAALAHTLTPKVSRIYTSPFYRCIQTITPFASRIPDVPVIVDQGLGDWYGKAIFEHPSPADLRTLKRFFPGLTERTSFVVSKNGEGLEQLHERVAYVMARIIADADAACTSEQPESIVISTHAAVLIALGRALTGRVPEDRSEKDFDTFTCSVSTYESRGIAVHKDLPTWTIGTGVPAFDWRGYGVGGGWNCTVNAAVNHLTNGGERNWHFSGDETFMDAMKPADSKDNDKNSGTATAHEDKPSRL